MIGYRCKCGDRKAFGSMSPFPCDRCPKCGSDLAASPDGHRDPPTDHDFSSVETVDTDEGPKQLTRCRYCQYSRAELEAQARREATA